jgi:hypothetical protein
MSLPTREVLSKLRAMPPWAIFLLGMYAGAALVTLGFQTYVRSIECSGSADCGISLLKGAVWSTIWPVSWMVYVAGIKR